MSMVGLLKARVVALERVEAGIPAGIEGLAAARDADLLAVLDVVRDAARLVDAIRAAAAGEVARRSAGDGDTSLARRLGERSAVGVVANRGGVTNREAVLLVKVGEATRPNEALSGEELQPKRPHLAAALAAGSISVPVADLIETTLSKVAHALWADQEEQLERQLVDMAASATWSVADFTRYCRRVPDHLDPENAEPREDALRALATIRETRLPNGLLRITADLHPELEGWWRAAMAAKTAPRRAGTFRTADGDVDAHEGQSEQGEQRFGAARTTDATRPDPMQRRLEALTTILRQSLQVDDGQAAGVDVTMLVTIPLDHLVSGIGAAHLGDVDEPISAATARRLAVQANLIPQVLDGKSVVLDQGLSKRLFSKQQRYALATRDQGCTFPGCPMPPSMCEVNHVGRWRHSGATDLNNGALLCGWHNRMMETGWDMRLDDESIPWFTPPATMDPLRTPVRGGKPRLADIA